MDEEWGWREKALYYANEARELDEAVNHAWVIAGVMGFFLGIGASLGYWVYFIR